MGKALGIITIVAILGIGAFFVFNGSNESNVNNANTSARTNTNTSSNSATTNASVINASDSNTTVEENDGIILTEAVVAQHNNANDCWLIINNNVYVVTSFLPDHEGGEERLIELCGQDATEGFRTQNGEGEHSSDADDIRASLFLGRIGDTITEADIAALE